MSSSDPRLLKEVGDLVFSQILNGLLYQDWQKIEQILEAYQAQQKEEFNLNKYAGVIKLTQDPLEYQQQIRDEWS